MNTVDDKEITPKIIEDQQSWLIREPKASDIPFIYDAWTKCYKHGSSLGKSCKSPLFFDEYKRVIDHILQDPLTSGYVACLPEEQDVIIGYSVFEFISHILHWVFVKESFRDFGVARSLIPNEFFKAPKIYCTHKTFYVEPIFRNNPNLEFNPFLLYQRGLS